MIKKFKLLVLLLTFSLIFTGPVDVYAATGTEIASTKQTAKLSKERKEHFSELMDEYSIFVGRYYYLDYDLDEMKEKTLKLVDNDSTDEDCLHYYFATLDPWSGYYTEKEFDLINSSMSGSFYGIGASVSLNTDPVGVLIGEVYEGSPAEKAGIKAGDIITKIDGKSTKKLTLSESVKLMRGEKGTDVKITFIRKNSKGKYKTKTVTATRDEITIKTVTSKFLKKNKIGYVKVTEFDENTDELFDKEISKLENKGIKSLVIDLRNNPGGYVDTAVNMAGRILPAGTLVTYLESSDGERENYVAPETDGTWKEDKTLDIPIVIMLNENSASASELFTGCIRDQYKHGMTIVGTKSYGKGVAQSFRMASGPDKDELAFIKLTTAGYFTPSGESVHKRGITPYHIVKNSTKKNAEDKQFKKALSYALKLR